MVSQRAVAADDGHLVVVGAHADAFARHVVDDDEVEVLWRRALRVRCRSRARSPRRIRPRRRPFATSSSRSARRMSTVGTSSRVSVSAPFLSLLAATSRGRQSATAAAMIRTRAPASASRTAACMSAAVSTSTTSSPGCAAGAGAAVTRVTRRAPPDRGRGELVAHLPARSIADEAHRVDRLSGSTRGDHEAQAVDGGVRPRRQGAPSPPTTITSGSTMRPVLSWPLASRP